MTIQAIRDPTAVRAAMEEYDRLGRSYFLEKYGYFKAREYMLRDPLTGRLYDSKAIVGVAYAYAFPSREPLAAGDFSGGEATVEQLLHALGFEVVRIGNDWTRAEVEETVRDYFAMLRHEALGEDFSKAEHNHQLRQVLSTRSKGSIEMKHQNISAVLDQLGLPFIRGYKPRGNYQALLRDVVLEHIQKEQPVLQGIVDALEEQVTPGNRTYKGVLIDPPVPEAVSVPRERQRLPRKLDYAARDERNRNLGYNGESWVMGFETDRLRTAKRPDLADRIDWAAGDRLPRGQQA